MLASALGANRPDDDPLVDAEGYTWGERRALAFARGEPEPQWDDHPPTPAEIAQMQRLMQNAPQVIMPPGGEPPV